jgi:phosphatidylinositol glycan class S
LALPHLPESEYLHPCPSHSPFNAPSDLTPPLSLWQVDQVFRQRAKENSDEARKTLAGIVRLVGKIKEMKLEKGVRDTVLGAVERLEKVSSDYFVEGSPKLMPQDGQSERSKGAVHLVS